MPHPDQTSDAKTATRLSLALFATSSFMYAVADGCIILSNATFFGATVGPSLRGRVSSFTGGAQRAAYTAGPLIGGFIAHALSPRATYISQVVIVFIGASFTAMYMPMVRSDQDLSMNTSKTPTSSEYLPFFAVVREHGGILIIAATFCSALTFQRNARNLFMPLEDSALGLSQRVSGALAGLCFFVDAAMFPVAGFLFDNYGRCKTGLLSLIGFGTASLVLVCLQLLDGHYGHLHLVGLVIYVLLCGFSNGISAGIVMVLSGDLAPASGRGTFMAIFRTLQRIGDIISPAVIGPLAGWTSLPVAESASALVALGGFFWGFCLVPETKPDTGTSKTQKTGGNYQQLEVAEADIETRQTFELQMKEQSGTLPMFDEENVSNTDFSLVTAIGKPQDTIHN